jgi:hypothetical protein
MTVNYSTVLPEGQLRVPTEEFGRVAVQAVGFAELSKIKSPQSMRDF